MNLKACKLIENVGISIPIDQNVYGELREKGAVGFAHFYLSKCWDDFELTNKADVKIFKQLLEIDSKLGTTQTEILFWCVNLSVRMDLIKV